jgi:hypothetical protein
LISPHRESTETFHYLETTTNTVPLASNFKPQVKVLSRRPVIAKRDPTTGMSQMTLDDDNDAPKKETPMTPEEIRAKQKREREEKQRRYEETRAKIFGESAPSSGASTPGTVTPPRPDGQSTPRGGRGRGRGGGQSGQRSQEPRHFEGRRQDIQSTSSRELFDPNLPSQAEPSSQGREGRESPARNLTPKNEHAPIRNPRGPDASGRGGFNLARRGAREG